MCRLPGPGPVEVLAPPGVRWYLPVSMLLASLLACSVCGCDPAALTVGLDRPSNQSVRLALEDRYLTKESGEAEEFEGERENRMTMRAQLAAAKSFVAQLEIPYYLWREHRGANGNV